MKLVKGISSEEDICDFTGAEVDRMEPCMVLLYDYKVKVRCYDYVYSKLEEVKESGKVIEFENLDAGYLGGEETCFICERKQDCFFIGEDFLCNRCFNEFINHFQKSASVFDDISFTYNSSGFAIAEYDEEEEFTSLIENGESRMEDVIICVGTHGGGRAVGYIGLSNLGTFIGGLENPCESDFIEGDTSGAYTITCCICSGEQVNNCFRIGNVPDVGENLIVCESCTSNLLNGLQSFVDSNEKYISSQLI